MSRSRKSTPVLVGIDGSEEALSGIRKAVGWSRILEKPLELCAAYDPFFHVKVFRAMAGSLSPERQEQVGISKQQDLHNRIIDDGLGKLYAGFLEDGRQRCAKMGAECDVSLL